MASLNGHVVVFAGIVTALGGWSGCDKGEVTPPSESAAAFESPPIVASADAADPARPTEAAEPLLAAPTLPTPADAGDCPAQGEASLGILVSPTRPTAGVETTVVAATFEGEEPLALRVEADGQPLDVHLEHRPGVPAAVIGTFDAPKAQNLRLVVGRGGNGLACETVRLGKGGRARPRPSSDAHVWPVSRTWTAAEEALFSAWVRELFHAPRGDDLAWKALHEVTSDPERNLLHDHYGWGEDDPDTKVGLHLRPDCADTPYFLRTYYAWKRELPFGFRQCSRGSAGKAPRCGRLRGILGKPDAATDDKPGELGVVQRFFRRTLAWGVHTGNGRTAFGDDDTDFYPLALSRRTLRPGSIYADPYGHIFVVVEMMPPDGDRPGILYAIDGQPDGSITRKRFWEGNFLWNADPALGGSGFKAFRPIDVRRQGDTEILASATDEEIARRPGYGDVSDEQASLAAPTFYDKMDALITPGARDPVKAQAEAIQALFEAAKVRVTSVQNGEDHVRGGSTVSMPDGFEIFETTGAWENYATPARDLRLLIAIDVVTGFSDKVARNAHVFLRDGETMEALRAKLEAARDELLQDPSLRFTYRRSDGSTWELSVADVIARAEAFEMAYNPNDCPEVRWGAPEGSEERKTCRRRAPAEQQRKMAAYRTWFTERRRPPRGDPGPVVDRTRGRGAPAR